jgi:hypothetical protein
MTRQMAATQHGHGSSATRCNCMIQRITDQVSHQRSGKCWLKLDELSPEMTSTQITAAKRR